MRVDYPSVEGAESPFAVYDWWRREAPVYRIPERPDVYVVSRYEDVVAVARDPATFSSVASRTGLNGFGFMGESTSGENLVESDPPVHDLKHRLTFEALKPGRIREHAGWIEEVVDGADRRLRRPRLVRLRRRAGAAAAGRGDDTALRDRRRRPAAARAVVGSRGVGPLVDGRGAAQATAGARAGDGPVHGGGGGGACRVAGGRLRQRPDPCPGGAPRQPSTRRRSTTLATNVLAGGAATTQHMLGGAMLLLLEHPDELARCRADAARIPRVLEEVMRLQSSVQWVPRVVTPTPRSPARPFPEGSYVLIVFASANRDAARFDEADAFDPGRKNLGAHIAFGVGRPHVHRRAARAARGPDRDRARPRAPARPAARPRRRDPPRPEPLLPRPAVLASGLVAIGGFSTVRFWLASPHPTGS